MDNLRRLRSHDYGDTRPYKVWTQQEHGAAKDLVLFCHWLSVDLDVSVRLENRSLALVVLRHAPTEEAVLNKDDLYLDILCASSMK